MSLERSEPLTYSIAQASPHSGSYVPQNILVDSPADQSSRWSGAHQGAVKQWLTLRLDSPAVVKTITFGKLNKSHPCNMKEFKLYIGTSEDRMTLVLHSSLKNDAIPETFSIRHTNHAGVEFPTRYLKIVPLSPHSPGFHLSIWHVSMTGIRNKAYIEAVQKRYDEHLETAALRLILKHLRQRRLLSPYQSILNRSGLQVEHPLVTEMYDLVVMRAKWEEAEQLLSKMAKNGLFNDYLQSCQPHAVWEKLVGTNADGDVPCARGGHAICIDSSRGIIYLFGGYDGKKSLDDFWSYDIQADSWTILCPSTTSVQNAPDARACHKMVFDTKTGSIYVFGRLGDGDLKKPEEAHSHNESSPRSEFYRYHTRGADKGLWDYLAVDTGSSGGPPLIFDHQMVMDSDAQILYVFGGKVVDDSERSALKYSGFYSYNVRLSKWKHIPLVERSGKVVPSRFGHSMLLEPNTRTLFIFAGQREDKYLADMYAYDIASNTTTELFSNFTTSGGPDASFTQRAVIDPQLKELYVFCGLTRPSHAGATTTVATEQPTWVFRYDSRPGQWVQVQRRSQPSHHVLEEPLPRYAHQVVYDTNTKTVFMHGGNAGPGAGPMERTIDTDEDINEGAESDKRLDDFWRMKLVRPAATEVMRKSKFIIRQQQFREMSTAMPQVQALNFLQNKVSSVVNHNDVAETEVFRSLLTYLLTPSSPTLVPKTYPSEHEDSPPRKRSRANTPEDGTWTNELSAFNLTPKAQGVHNLRLVDADGLRRNADPIEHECRETEGKIVDEATAEEDMDAEIFKQRTELFESLMKYVSVDAKQPEESLLDLIEA